jgi:hypothetical protein
MLARANEAVLLVEPDRRGQHRVGHDHDPPRADPAGEVHRRFHQQIAVPLAARGRVHRHLGDFVDPRLVGQHGTGPLYLPIFDDEEDLPAGLDDGANRITEDLAIRVLDHEVLLDPGPVESLELLAVLRPIGDDRRHRPSDGRTGTCRRLS